ncbi:MAG: hypothetical protein A4E72_02372 [Syntrophus sp. PtaU1.Bin208]|nr:MAG: hypothetical protein A4E72_02372 [Syntrophus sp. PtaU1.Bin208]
MTDETDSIIEPSGKARQQTESDLAQELHNRARASSQELHKLLVSFATALLAVNYFALVASDNPAAPGPQTWMALLGLSAQGVAVLGGLLAYFSDMKCNYHRAKALQAKDRPARNYFFRKRNRWRWLQLWSVRSECILCRWCHSCCHICGSAPVENRSGCSLISLSPISLSSGTGVLSRHFLFHFPDFDRFPIVISLLLFYGSGSSYRTIGDHYKYLQ